MFEEKQRPATDAQLERVRAVLAAAIQLPTETRSAAARELCSGDEQLVAEVEELLSFHSAADKFLTRPLPELLGAETKTARDLCAGTVLKSRYRIDRKVAQSDFASVYFAADEVLGDKRVVIKIPDQLLDESALRESFAAELHSLSRVQHPNVVGITDVGTLENGRPFLVLTYVPGITLREVIRNGPIKKQRAYSIVQGIGRALAAAHAVDVWHLDLKPENIIVSEPDSIEERITLIDFGIAKLKHDAGGSLVAGSPRYMAPEQHENPSAQCDIYALALITFELMAGHLPVEGRPIADQLPHGLGSSASKAIISGLEDQLTKRFSEVSAFLEAFNRDIESATPRMIVAIALSLALAAAGYFWFAPHENRTEYTKPVPIVSTPERERNPAFSPDGQEIYYSLGTTGHVDIYKKALSGGDPVLVVGGETDDSLPRVSPDGRHLAFVRHGEKFSLMQKHLSDGQEELLVSGTEVDSYSWSADGKRLIFSGIWNGVRDQLRVLEIFSKSVQLFDIQGAADCVLAHPRVSPNGKNLAFACRWFQGSDDLFFVPIDAALKQVGPVRRITNLRDRIDSVEWAPDSKSLLYIGGPLGNGNAFRVFLDRPFTSEVVAAVSEATESLTIPLSNWKIAFNSHMSDSNVWMFEVGSGRPATQIVASSYEDEQGYLSPDGRWLLFDSRRSGDLQIWVAEADGKNARQLTNFRSVDMVAAIWAPNSREAIISVRSKDLGAKVFKTLVEGQSSLAPYFDGAEACSASRDGKWIYIVKGEGTNRSIWRTQYPESFTTELIADGGAFGMESADGLRFYFSKRDEKEGIWSQPLPRGLQTRFVSRLHKRNLFAVGEKGVFYIAPTARGIFPGLFFQNFQSEPEKLLLSFEHGLGWGLGLSSDERKLIFTQLDVWNSDIMLVERFH